MAKSTPRSPRKRGATTTEQGTAASGFVVQPVTTGVVSGDNEALAPQPTANSTIDIRQVALDDDETTDYSDDETIDYNDEHDMIDFVDEHTAIDLANPPAMSAAPATSAQQQVISPWVAYPDTGRSAAPVPRVRQRFTFTPERIGYIALLVFGTALRLWDLGAKPLHHDESLHAYFSLQFMKDPGGYTYDPLLHGPFQFHIIPFFYAIGQLLHLSGNGANDFTVRLLPALMGAAMIILPYFLRHQLGRWGALATAFLLAISPSFVYYSRFVRDDIYVTFFTLLLVVAAIQYSRTRHLGWLITATAALVLSYTAMENTFFVIAVFGSYLIAVVLWDLGPNVGRAFGKTFAQNDQALAGRVITLGPFAIIMAIAGLFGLHWLAQVSNTISVLAASHPGVADPLNPDVAIRQYEIQAVSFLLVLSIIISLLAIMGLISQIYRQEESVTQLQPRWRRWINPRTHPAVDTLLSTHWIQWFLVFVVAWVIFATFFWKLPEQPTSFTDAIQQLGDGFQKGIGRGLLQGIYYWLEQQHVARGGQPWYYYFVLIPLYEPLILVFGLAGLLRALLQPTRFRLFVVYWFVANVALYSWAGEKMPWLVVHILLPLVVLAGFAFEWIIGTLVRGAQGWWQPTRVLVALGGVLVVSAIAATTTAATVGFSLLLGVLAIIAVGVATGIEQWARRHARRDAELHGAMYLAPALRWTVTMNQSIAAGSLVLALVLLVPTLWNMQRVSFFDPSVAPNEMLVYVQTTTDVTKTMTKLDALDRLKNGGKQNYTLHVGVTAEAVWPFVWYLHQYTNVTYNYKPGVGTTPPDVILAGDSDTPSITAAFPTQYLSQEYRLRWWWDESYKLPTCSPTKTTLCSNVSTWDTGVGPFLWMSYGSTPPAGCANLTQAKCDHLNAPFNGALAAGRYWNWLWNRQNISGTTPGSTNFVIYIDNADAKQVAP